MTNICWTKGPIVQSQLAEKARLVNAIWLVKKQLTRLMSMFNKYSVTQLQNEKVNSINGKFQKRWTQPFLCMYVKNKVTKI